METYRGFVYPWVMDHNGHMNVQSYTARFDEATWHFLGSVGLAPQSLLAGRRAMVALDQHTRYRREVFAASLLHIDTELLEAGTTSLRFVHTLYDSQSGQQLASSEIVGVLLDLDTRKPAPLPPAVRALAAAPPR